MSLSLAAASADGYYYPPEYDPKKHGSINKFRGSHPLGVRAKKIHEGILVIRFEMPFKVWCRGCDAIIAKGVRFNAEKKCVGNYFTTKILEFKMTCYHCPMVFRITTDPKSCEYLLTAGLRLKVETYDPKDAETIQFEDDKDRTESEFNPMLKLEKKEEAAKKATSAIRQLEDLMDISEDRSDTYALNSMLRKRHRERKVEIQKEELEQERKKNFVIPLQDLSSSDIAEAKTVRYLAGDGHSRQVAREAKRVKIQRSSIFTATAANINNKLQRHSTGASTSSTTTTTSANVVTQSSRPSASSRLSRRHSTGNTFRSHSSNEVESITGRRNRSSLKSVEARRVEKVIENLGRLQACNRRSLIAESLMNNRRTSL